jgi:hypothetical protein
MLPLSIVMDTHHWQVVIVALQEKKIMVRIEDDGEAIARTDIGGVDGCKLLGVYVHMTQGWVTPSVEHIELVGVAPDGSPAFEKFKK